MPAFGTFAHFCLSLPSLSILFRKFCFSLTSSMLPPDLKAPHLCLRHVLSPVMHFVADQCTDCFFLIYCASLIVRKKNLESNARKKLIELLALFSFLPIWHSKFHIGANWHTVSLCVGPLNTPVPHVILHFLFVKRGLWLCILLFSVAYLGLALWCKIIETTERNLIQEWWLFSNYWGMQSWSRIIRML